MIKNTSYTMKFELSLYHSHVIESHKIHKTYIYIYIYIYIYVFFEYIIHIFISNMENTYAMSTLLVHTILLF